MKMNKLVILGIIFGPIIIGFFVFVFNQILNIIKRMYKWIVEFINEVNNKPKSNKIEPNL